MARFHLIRPRSDVLRDLRRQIKSGDDIGEGEYDDLDVALDDETKWNLYNEELLARSFSDSELLDGYKAIDLPDYDEEADDEEIGETHTERMRNRNTFLESVVDRLHLVPESGGDEIKAPSSSKVRLILSPSKVFIIHGHDVGARDAVTLFVKNLGLSPIVLQNQPNEGMSIDRKLEKYSNVDYAIAILTPDDNQNPRPNVALELGWFGKAIGQQKVCILYKEGTKIPSDVGGVGRILMDDHEGWKQKVAREIKSAGIHFDPDWYLKE